MKLLSTFFSTLLLAAKRLWNHRLLMLCLLAGLVAAVGLLSSIPLYADAAHHQLLQGQLTEAGTYRPPFAFLWRYVGAWHGDVAWEAYEPVDQYLSQQAGDVVGLPLESSVRHVQTGNLRLFPAADAPFAQDEPLLWTNLGFISRLEEHVEVIEGVFPHAKLDGDAIPMLVSQALAEQMGLQVGERYTLFGSTGKQTQLPVQIAGVWRARNPLEPFWFYQPAAFDEVLLTSEEVFETQVVPALEKPVSLAVWYQIFDGADVRAADVPGLLSRVATAESRVNALLNHTTLDASPVEALRTYRREAQQLTVMLTLFSIPTVGLVIYFIGLIAGMVVQRSQGEIATWRSRGTTRAQIVGIYALEGLLVGAVGLAGGLLLGRWLAALMGQTRTFLALETGFFQETRFLDISLSPAALLYGLSGVGLALLALLAPALGASRHTIVTFKWERARALIRPLWQRFYLDLFLLALPLYGWYTLNKQGTITPIYPSTNLPTNPFSNPLLFLVPALFCFALALLFVRLFPRLMEALAWLAARLPGTTPVLTLRQLARASGQYTGPLLLLALTLSLATFTASMALTLDSHLHDRVYYQVGADLNLAELGESTAAPEQPTLFGQPTAPQETEKNEPRWLFLPVSEHLRVDGVRAAARVGDYTATANIGGGTQTGRLLGLDRVDFSAVAFFRPDLADGESLGGLMNRLALDPAGVLVSRDFMARYGLSVGDPLRLTISTEGESHAVEFTIVGPLKLFPALYPQDGPFFVANLDYVHEGMGGVFPYDVWLSTDPDAPGESIVSGVRAVGFTVVAASDARATILAEQTRPERQGLFGLLSVGFLAAAALTVLGFLVYAVVSFRRRFIELGMLRAVGLSVGQMALFLTGEQAWVILTGAGLGTGLGAWASHLFIPYLQIGADKTARVPPFHVQPAWSELVNIYVVFGVMFIVAVAVLIALLLRMKVFEAVKLGETA